jgi:hypothetical protein
MMKRTFTSFIAAAAVSVSLPLFAQSSTTTAGQSSTSTTAGSSSTTAGRQSSTTADASAKNMTLTGCVEKNKSGGYWLRETSAGAAAGASSSTTAPTGTSGAATTTADNKDKNEARGASAHRMWNLENAHEIDKFANQTVQVTGRAKDSTSGDEVKGTTGRETEARDFHVESVRLVSASCQ